MELIVKAAYFAGIVDGEGTIMIAKQSFKNGRPDYYVPGMFVSNTERKLLEWIQSQFGGSIQKSVRAALKTHKPVYRLQFYGFEAEAAVHTIFPYLILKREQAECFLALRELMRKHGRSNVPFSAEERATREQLYWACKKLNKRGIGQVERLSEETRESEMQQSALPGTKTGRD